MEEQAKVDLFARKAITFTLILELELQIYDEGVDKIDFCCFSRKGPKPFLNEKLG